jgi:uncharacterized protein YbjT (DUF2867 family)
MKVLILGGTGRTGKYVVEEAIRSGHKVTCLVRNESSIKVNDPALTVLKGSPEIPSELGHALAGCSAVISTLNISRYSDFPWSKLRTPPTFMSDAIKNLVKLSEEQEIKRVVVCSAWGAAETKNEIPGLFRCLIDNSNIGFAYRDHERQEEILRRSRLQWTIVRPTGLINIRKLQVVIESYNGTPKPKMTISRRSVAKYLVDALERDSLIYKAPVISGK